MLNLVVRAARNYEFPKFVAAQQQRLQLMSSFTVKDILYETSDETGTLVTRFAKHIGIERYKFDPLVPTSIRYADYFPVHDLGNFHRELRKIAANQLPALIVFAFTYRSNGDPAKFVRVLNDIDAMCMQRLPEMDYDTLLQTLYALLFLIPNKITRTDFYKSAAPRLVQEFGSDFPKEKFVQVCLYMGLSKKNTPLHNSNLFKEFVDQHLETYVKDLSAMDMAVVSSALYKTVTRTESTAYLQRLQEEALDVRSDDALLVTFIKNLRFEQIKSEKICEQLGSLCNSDGLKKLRATGLAHLFGYFAENKWDDNKYTKNIVDEFMRRLKDLKKTQKYTEYVRAKDLCMFLWCCSQLNCKLSDTELQYLETVVLNKVENDEFRNFSDQLVDCCLSLWMLGHKSRNLLEEAVTLSGQNKSNVKIRDPARLDSRLTVLQSAAAIEYPAWLSSIKCFEEKCPAPAYLLKNRPEFAKYTQQLATEKYIVSASLVCPIKGINIPSILVELTKSNSKIFVELIEDKQLLRFTNDPVAILKLKINLLTVLGYKVVCMRPSDLEEKYTCLKDFAFNEETFDNTRESTVSST